MKNFVLVIFMMFGHTCWAEVVRIATPPGVVGLQKTKLLFEEIYSNLGYKVAWIHVPYLRTRSILANDQADAELLRLEEGMGPEAIKIDYPICSVNIFVYLRKGAFKEVLTKDVLTIDKLKNISVVVRRGSALAKMLGDKKNIVKALNSEQMVQFFNGKRVDAIVTLGSLENQLVEAEKYILKRATMFHFVGVKHKKLVPQIKAELETKLTPTIQELIAKELVTGLTTAR